MTDFETHPAGTAARIAELEAALDSIETSHGMSGGGNLWRFWSKKAQEVATNNTKLRHHVEHWRQEVGKLHSRVATLTDQLTRANAAAAAAYEVAAHVLDDEIDLARIAFPQAVPILAADRKAIRALATPDQTAALDKLIAEAVKPYVEALTKLRDLMCENIEDDDGNSGCGQCEGDCTGCIAHSILAASKKGGV